MTALSAQALKNCVDVCVAAQVPVQGVAGAVDARVVPSSNQIGELKAPVLLPTGRAWRRDLAANDWIWGTFVAVFGTLAASSVVLPLLWPSLFPADRIWPLAAVLGSVALAARYFGPPAIPSVSNHLAILAAPLCTSAAVVAFAPHSVIPVGACAFAGTFAPSRLQSRRGVVAHLVAAAALLVLAATAAGTDAPTTLAVVSMVPVIFGLGGCVVLILEASDQQAAELEQLAWRDDLTGLANRFHLIERLNFEIARHRGAELPLAVVLLDLDRFAAYNAHAGEDAGDELLRSVATTLTQVAGAALTVARTGDDEFAVLLPETSRAEAEYFADVLSHALRSATALSVSAGTGVAMYPRDAGDAPMLMEVAATRLALKKEQLERPEARPRMWEPSLVTHAPPRTEARSVRAALIGGFSQVSRAEIATNRVVWIATGLGYLLYTALFAVAFCATRSPTLLQAGAVVAMMAVTIVMATREPPAIRSLLNHAMLLSAYVGSFAFIAEAPDLAAWALGPLAFLGPLFAVRLERRRDIAVHLTLVSAGVAAIFAAGIVDVRDGLALMLGVFGMWAIGLGHTLHLESADEQSQQINHLVRRDPFTGLGNRRLYHERLHRELALSDRTNRPFTMIAVGLPTSTSNANELDAVARRASTQISRVLPKTAVLVRFAPERLIALLPNTATEAAPAIINAICSAADVTTGSSSYPLDTSDPEVLLHIAQWRQSQHHS